MNDGVATVGTVSWTRAYNSMKVGRRKGESMEILRKITRSRIGVVKVLHIDIKCDQRSNEVAKEE